MSRTKRDSKIDTRSARAKLPGRKAPYCKPLESGRYLGYRKPITGKAGSWIARYYDSETRKVSDHALGTADDFVDADGKLVLDWSQAQKKARAWFDQVHHRTTGEAIQRGPFTVKDAWEAYCLDCERRGVKAMDRMKGAARLHILPALGDVAVEKLTQGRVEKWHHDLAKSPRALRAATIAKREKSKIEETPALSLTEDEKRARKDSANRVLTVLKALLNFAKSRHLTTASGDAWREAKPFRGTTSARIRFLTIAEQVRLVNSCPPDFRRLVQGALFTGARYGELSALRVEDFDPKGASGMGTAFIAESKSGKARHIVLTAEGRAFFESLVTGQRSGELMFLREAFETRNWRGEKTVRGWSRSEQFRLLKAALRTAKIEDLTFHELRHTYASMLVNAGVPLAYVGAQLGHADTRMVEKHYGHLAPSALAEAIAKLSPELGIHTPENVSTLNLKPRSA